LQYSCNSGWSAPPSSRWGNSVLCTTHSPTRLAQQSAMPHSGRSACHPPLLSAFVLHPLPHPIHRV
jgi:hypothetical protein